MTKLEGQTVWYIHYFYNSKTLLKLLHFEKSPLNQITQVILENMSFHAVDKYIKGVRKANKR